MRKSVNILKLQGLLQSLYSSAGANRDAVLRLDRFLHHLDILKLFPKLGVITYKPSTGLLSIRTENKIDANVLKSALEGSGVDRYVVTTKDYVIVKV